MKGIQQLKYVILDIGTDFFNAFLCFIQLSLGIGLLSFVVSVAFQCTDTKKTMEKLMDNHNIYLLKDETSNSHFQFLINDKQADKSIKKLYKKIIENNKIELLTEINCYKFYPHKTVIIDHSLYATEEEKELNQLIVSPNFFSIYQLKGDFDSEASPLQYEGNEPIPIILGAKFKTEFTKGDIIKDEEEVEYRVQGFLEENSYFLTPKESKEVISLDDYVLRPSIIGKKDSKIEDDCFNVILDSYYIANNRSSIEQIAKESVNQKLFDIRPEDFTERLEIMKSDFIEEIVINVTLLSIILIFAFIGTTCNILEFIVEYKKEFAVHMLCGATKLDILIRVVLHIVLLIVIAVIPVLCYMGINRVTLVVSAISLSYAILLSIYPIYFLEKETIISVIRRN